MRSSGRPAFPVFNTETLGPTVCPWPSRGRHTVQRKPFCASGGGGLFLLRGCYFDVLGAPPLPDSSDGDTAWSWGRVRSLPPLEYAHIGSSAVHTDGRTLFISEDESTFSSDTERLEWTCHGDWVMPSKGQAYFDGELDA